MTSGDIRQSFLTYFSEHGHAVVPSGPLVPSEDPTLLFTNAGMNQFKDLFLGREQRRYQRATTSQKCMRVSGKHNDLNNVGPSLRHHTFFEMLGNFSFGDYFKTDAIPFAWELLTDRWNIPPERLYATIFKGDAEIPRDDDAYAIWQQLVPEDRIVELGLAENFWAMGDTGPCGRCSEIHYHRGDHLPCTAPRCLGIDCNCDRYVEIWNNVFMEFERQTDGTLSPLPAPSIDTGMGLERIVAVLQDTLSNYDTDLFTPLLRALGDASGVEYGPLTAQSDTDATAISDVSMRVVADHTRAMTFLIADGVLPSNEWRGYVLRKIMRRAMRHGKRLGLRDPFLHRLVDVVVREMGTSYPELVTARDSIVQVVQLEEERFDAVLTDGLPRLETALDTAHRGTGIVEGENVFRLYDTHGLPYDFMDDLASERGVSLDRAAFEHAMELQREKSRAGQAFGKKTVREFGYDSEHTQHELQEIGDRFEGYESTRLENVPVKALFDAERQHVPELGEGATGYLVLERTPFYVESGGQVSDRGHIRGDTGRATVDAMGRLMAAGPRVHSIQVVSGVLRTGDRVTVEVDSEVRDATRRNHTATHLLHAALRNRLGTHISQAGSLVTPDRFRFDFTHSEPLTADHLTGIEQEVNQQIIANRPVETEVRSTQDAIADGAMALFGEKYGDHVRVVAVPGVSMELCGGTHCRATGDIGSFVITQEGGVAAGVRRIEALTGTGAVGYLRERRDTLDQILDTLSVPAGQAVEAVHRLQLEAKQLGREVERLKITVALGGARGSTGSGAEPDDDTHQVRGGDFTVTVVTRHVTGLDKSALRALSDSLRDRFDGDGGVVILACETAGKLTIVVSVTRNLVPRVHAGHVVKAIAPIVGGRGGGRPDFAEAGGTVTDEEKPAAIDALFAEGRAAVGQMLAA